ncbi:MAG: hypothetical protein GX643_16510 [Acidimicrobiales bacterium]|nr:hypothetical protein [Acidimicrobiales bacterium]
MSEHRPGRLGPQDLLREGAANVAGGRWLVLLLGLLCGAVGFTVTASTTGTADRALREGAELDQRGRYVLRVASGIGQPASLDLAFCDRLAVLEGVEAAGGIRRQDRVRLATGALVRLQEATAGLVVMLGRGDVTDPSRLLVGALAAERNGLRDHAWVATQGDGRRLEGARVALIPETARSARLDDSLVRIVAPSGRADECWAEVDPARKAVLAVTIQNLLPDDQPAVVVDFNPALAEVDPERDLREVPRSPLILLGGVAVGLLVGMWWYARRQEWVLYRVFGLGVVRRMGIATVEWALVGGIPLAVGAAWAVILANPADRLAVVLGWSSAAVAAAVSLAVVGLWGAISSRPRPSTVLKGG